MVRSDLRREYALRPGTLAPLVGTLMEIVRGIRCPDGRLILLVMAVGRIRVRPPWSHRWCAQVLSQDFASSECHGTRCQQFVLPLDQHCKQLMCRLSQSAACCSLTSCGMCPTGHDVATLRDSASALPRSLLLNWFRRRKGSFLQVARAVAEVPFGVADVERLPDDEEPEEWQPLVRVLEVSTRGSLMTSACWGIDVTSC